MILQHGGLDISDLLRSDREHAHSDTAFEMLESYCIGTLSKETTETLPKTKMADSAIDLRKSVDFIDLEKPMFSQVLYGNFDRDFYIQQVHIPRHTKQSAPIFGHPLLEALTKTYWWVIPLFWAPVVYFAFTRSLQILSLPFAAALFVVGLANWTLIEYSLHRALFHMDNMLPNNRYAMTIHFMTHGVHHFLPMDKYVRERLLILNHRMRLVMPPALGVILSWPIWTAHLLVLPAGYGDAIISGSFVGFVTYDLIHCICFFSGPL